MPTDTSTTEFLRSVFSQTSPDQFLEIRTIGTNGSAGQQFLLVGRLQDCEYAFPGIGKLDGMTNVYYSVIPRRERRGTADACGSAPAIWADFDKGPPEALPLPPSIVIETSPAKFQALWLLDRPSDNLAMVEGINRAIAALHNADPNACDRARVLRLPGFRNLKYADRPRAQLVACHPDRRFTIQELADAFPATPSRVTAAVSRHPSSIDAPPWLSLVYEAILDFLSSNGESNLYPTSGGVKARCPFHDDQNPSLSLHPMRGWKCFAGCGQGKLTALAARLGVRIQEA